MKKMKKLIALFLAASMLTATVGALEVQPEEAKTEYALSELPQNIKTLLPDSSQILSVQKDDDPYSIITNNEDGTHTATVFAAPVKYQTEDGKTELIDTSIVSNGLVNSVFQGYQYKNKANSFTTEFSKDADKGLRFTTEDSRLVMTPVTEENPPLQEALTETSAETAEEEKAAHTDEIDQLEIPYEITASVEEANTESKPDDAFVYDNAFGEHTKLKYYNTSVGFKEDIILEQNVRINRFSFEIDTNGDIPRLTEDAGMILVYDKDNSEEQKYRFGSLYAYDSFTPGTDETTDFEHLTFDCHYELEELGDSRYRITAVISEEWLNHPETIYPVTINPSMTVPNTATNIEDTYIRESAPASNYYLESRLRIGNYNGTNYTSGKCFSYVWFKQMPSLSYVYVQSATLTMYLLSGQSTAQPARAWRVTAPWESKAVTWNSHPAYTDVTADTNPDKELQYYQFNVTDIVNKWYNGSTNYGFLHSYVDTAAHDLNSLYSSDCGISTVYPSLSFNYVTGPTLSAITEGIYYIRNQNSGKYIDVLGQHTYGGANIHQWSFHGGPSQQWKITQKDGRWYTLEPLHAPGMAMDVDNSKMENGTNIRLCAYNNANAQQFGFVKLSNGAYRIVTKITSGQRGASVESSSTADGGNIHQWAYSGAANDHWFLEKADQVVANVRIFAVNDGGSSSWNMSGHAFISIENTATFNYPIGAFDLRNKQEMTLGTWGNQGFNGIWYNLETGLNTSPYVYLTDTLQLNEVSLVNQYISSHNSWSELNNCSSFAVGLWNTISNTKLSAGTPNTPTTLKKNILAEPGDSTGRILKKLTPVGYVDTNGDFIERE